MNYFQMCFYFGLALFAIALFFGIVYGSSNSTSNSTNEMVFGDKWKCGYINATTTLENLRDCFRD